MRNRYIELWKSKRMFPKEEGIDLACLMMQIYAYAQLLREHRFDMGMSAFLLFIGYLIVVRI